MRTERNLYLLGLGSNLGEREGNITQALREISVAIGPLLKASKFLETEPVGAADRLFLNGAAIVSTAEEPPAVMAKLLAIEAMLGRIRRTKWENRPIDLDILLWAEAAGDAGALPSTRVWSTQGLVIPHPLMLERPFALLPAAEIAPEWRHPLSGKTLTEEVKARGF